MAFFLMAAMSSVVFAAEIQIEKIQIFTTLNKKPVLNGQTAIPIEVYYLDEGQKVLDDLNQSYREKTKGMSSAEMIRVYEGIRFKDERGRNLPFVDRMVKSNEGHALAVQFDIKKIPAIVFNDGLAVVYGETNIAGSIERFKAWAKK